MSVFDLPGYPPEDPDIDLLDLSYTGWCYDANCPWGGPRRVTADEAQRDLDQHEAETGHHAPEVAA